MSRPVRRRAARPVSVSPSIRPLRQALVGLAWLAAGTSFAQGTPAPVPAPVSPQTAGPVQPQAAVLRPTVAQAGAEADAPAAAATGASSIAPEYVLPALEVSAEAEPYRATESALTRLPVSLERTPQTVAVVPRAVLEEEQATTVREALRNVSGITISAGEGGRQGDTFYLRGFSAQTDVFRDGVRDLGWFTRDTFNLENVEVFFGPSSVLFGRGSTGGAVNLVTKQAQSKERSRVMMLLGSAPNGRLELDVNHLLGDHAAVRLNAMGQLADVASRDGATANRGGIAPSLRVDLSESTTLRLDHFYQHEDSTPDYGQPYFNGLPVSSSLGVPRNTFYGVVGEDHERVNANVSTGQLRSQLSSGLTFTDTLRYGQVNRDALPTAPRGLTPVDAPTSLGRERRESTLDNVSVVNQADLRALFDTGPVHHTLNVGLELSRESRQQKRTSLNAVGLPTGKNLPVDLFHPDPTPDLSAVVPTFASSNRTTQSGLGLYASDQVRITRYLELLGSLRFDAFNTDYQAEDASHVRTALYSRDRFLNWRVGAEVHPVERASVYAMLGSSSNPSAEAGTLSKDTVSLDPERSRTYEVGAKAELLEERLGVSAALFRTEKLNARVPNDDPDGPPQILAGKQRVQGLNVGVAGAITDRWHLTASYTLMPSEILSHPNPILVGQPLPNAPKHSASVWTTVRVLDRLTLGGGVTAQSAATVNNPSTAAQTFNRVPSYCRFDAVATYAWKQAELQLNVSNLTDALYYDQYYGGHAVPAAGRSASLAFAVHL